MNKKVENGIRKIISQYQLVLNTHQGDVKILNIDGNRITLAIAGKCAHCVLARIGCVDILKSFVEEKYPSVELIINSTNNKK